MNAMNAPETGSATTSGAIQDSGAEAPDPRPRYALAADRMAALIASVTSERLDDPTPCAEYDVRALLRHIVDGTHCMAAVGEGAPAAPPAPGAPPAASGGGGGDGDDVPGDGWPAAYEEARARLTAAWADDARLDAVVTVPWGEVPGRIALSGTLLETVTHAWDLAQALGTAGAPAAPGSPDSVDGPPQDDPLASFALGLARRLMPEHRRGEGTPFGPVRTAPEGAGAHDRLAAWLGRGADWAVRALAAQVRGPVLAPGDAKYDEERSGFQTGWRHSPDLIVGAMGADDVRAAVRYARVHGLPVAVQATGHGLATPARGGVLITTRRMAGLRVDAGSRTVWIEAGVRWGAVVEEAAKHGLAPLSGSAPGVGAVSYVLGGGLGLLARQYGYAADHVRRIDVVTADGRAHRLTPDDDPASDGGGLFWALLGGGGGLGVVTGLEIGLVPVERLYGGRLVFEAGLVEEVLRVWGEWTRTVPDELTSSVTVLPFPDLPGLPEALRGRYVAQVHVAFNGPVAEGERLVAPLRAVGPRLTDTLRTLPYTESATVHSDPDQPHAYQGGNVMLGGGLPDAGALRRVLELTGPEAPGMFVLSLRHLGGALSRPPAVPNAVGHRDARYLLGLLSVPGGPAADAKADEGADALRTVHQAVYEAVAPWTTGSCRNFLYGADERVRRGQARQAYESGTRRRLTGLKALHDPAGTFGPGAWATREEGGS